MGKQYPLKTVHTLKKKKKEKKKKKKIIPFREHNSVYFLLRE